MSNKLFICKICGLEFSNKEIGRHVRQIHGVLNQDYYDKYFKKEKDGKCLTCGEQTKFRSLVDGYSRFCSSKCANLHPETRAKIESTNLERFGARGNFGRKGVSQKAVKHSQSEEAREKRAETNLERYGVENGGASKQAQDKIKGTNLKKYGVEHSFQAEEVKEKSRKTWLKRYGVDHPTKVQEVKNKSKKSRQQNIDKFEVENNCICKDKLILELGDSWMVANLGVNFIKHLDRYFISNDDVAKIKRWLSRDYSDVVYSNKKYVCKICGYGTDVNYVLSSHIAKYHCSAEDYYLNILQNQRSFCKTCNKPTKFISMYRGYSDYCSISCAQRSEDTLNKKKQTCLDKFGVEHQMQNKDVRDKVRATSIENSGAANGHGQEALKKIRQGYLDKYGVDSHFKVKEIRDKIDQTCMDKYGDVNFNNPEKMIKTKRNNKLIENKTANIEIKGNKPTLTIYNRLRELFPDLTIYHDVIVNLDHSTTFYVKEKDLYIDLLLFPSHGGKRFTNSEEDLAYFNNSNNKDSLRRYWMGIDVEKYSQAKDLNLTYITFYSNRDVLMFTYDFFNFWTRLCNR